jgi:hypothetical protein
MAKSTKTSFDSVRNRIKETAHKVEGRVWKPENPGEFMVGRLNQIDANVGDFDSTMLRFTDPNGDEIAVWQRGTLKTRISNAHVGEFLMIEFAGTEPPKKRGQDPMNLFDVYLLTREQFEEMASAAEDDDLPF